MSIPEKTPDEAVEIVQRISVLKAKKKTQLAALAETDSELEQLKQLLAGWLNADEGIILDPDANGTKELGDDGTATKALQSLRRNPGKGWGVIAAEVYGGDTPDNRTKAQNIIYYLRKRGFARPIKGKRGKWEAVLPTS
jgi:hypothetical protein